MSSRDGSGQSGSKRRPPNANAPLGSSKTQGAYDIDPAEIDRYLSGQPQRAPQRSPRVKTSATQTTPDQLDRLRRLVGTEDEPARATTPVRQSASSASLRQASPIGYGDQNSGQATRSSSTGRNVPANSFDDVYYEEDYVYGGSQGADYLDEYPGQWDEEGDPAIAGQSGQRARSLPAMPSVTIPRSITSAAILQDRRALALIGISAVSLIGMAVLVSNRIDTLPSEIGTHISASGVLGRFASREAIWRIPLLAVMLTLMNLVIGIFAARFDRFASRLVLAAGLLVQFLAWVALIRIL